MINTKKVWIVNGVLDKVDGNFIQSNFKVTSIGNTGLCVGSYPSSEKDFITLHEEGVKTIINLHSLLFTLI